MSIMPRSRPHARKSLLIMMLVVLVMATVPGGLVAAPQIAQTDDPDIYGVVTVAGTTDPVEGARVIANLPRDGDGPPLWGDEYVTGADGTFAFYDVATHDEPRFQIEVYTTGYANAFAVDFAFEGEPVEQNIELVPGDLAISGTLHAADTEAPLPGQRVILHFGAEERPWSAWTNDEGVFAFYGLDVPSENLMLDVWVEGYESLNYPDGWPDDPDPRLDYTGEALTDLELVMTPEPPVDVINIAGAGRYETAVEASKKAYPDGAEIVVIATGRNWPDALGGTALAGVLDAPILLVNPDTLPDATAGEIDRLGASRAIILGGNVAVGPAVEAAIMGILGMDNVERIAGESRYETADAVALRVIDELGDAYDGTAFVATGGAFADAVAAAPLAASQGWPLFLAHPTAGIVDHTVDAMADVSNAIVLGGELAVSAAVQSELEVDLGEENVIRIAGGSRYATAVFIAEHGVLETELGWDRVGIATGQAYPDALSGGVLQGKAGSVMLLTRTNSLPDETAGALAVNSEAITTVTYFGGVLAVGRGVRAAVAQALAE